MNISFIYVISFVSLLEHVELSFIKESVEQC